MRNLLLGAALTAVTALVMLPATAGWNGPAPQPAPATVDPQTTSGTPDPQTTGSIGTASDGWFAVCQNSLNGIICQGHAPYTPEIPGAGVSIGKGNRG